MTASFIAIAALMVAATLALLLLPLMRKRADGTRSRAIFGLALALLVAVPLGTWGLYHHVGNPDGLNPVMVHPPKMTMGQAIERIKQRLKQHPEDKEGWLVLGQAYTLLGKPAGARDAYAGALKLDPNNPNIMVSWAESAAQATPDRQITGKPLEMIQRAVKLDPTNQRGLWLLGISQVQQGHFADASLTWRRLRALLPADSDVANAVTKQITLADARASGKSEAEAEAMVSNGQQGQAPAQQPAANAGASLTVHVSLADALKAKLKPGDTLFVFARAEGGPPMPLAVARMSADKLPATVTLTDAMSMAPGMNLSSAGTVQVTARISASGQALAQPGDLEGSSKPVKVGGDTPVDIVIDQVH